jgi:periplasmic divalent cation tolerance protein
MIVPANDVRIVLTTAGSREEAERIAHALVEEHLAACVNLVPGLTSIYRWQGAVETGGELLLIVKTTADGVAAVEETILRLHSYEVPELLVITPEAGGKPYLDWLVDSCGRVSKPGKDH